MNDDDNAKKIISLLEEDLASMDSDTASALAKARYRAVTALGAQMAGNGRGGLLRIFHGYFDQYRFAAITLVAGVLIAFVMTQQFTGQDSLEQSDAFMLGSSDLPPEAYLDKGFDVWLERN